MDRTPVLAIFSRRLMRKNLDVPRQCYLSTSKNWAGFTEGRRYTRYKSIMQREESILLKSLWQNLTLPASWGSQAALHQCIPSYLVIARRPAPARVIPVRPFALTFVFLSLKV